MAKVEVMASISLLIPSPQPDPNKKYQGQPGGGRNPMPAGKIFEGIVDVLPTGWQWKALPKKRFASLSAIDTHFLRWAESGFLGYSLASWTD